MSICDLSPEEILFLEVVFSIALIDGRSMEELNLLGNVLTTIGAILMTQAAALDCLQNNSETHPDNTTPREDWHETIAALELRLAEIEKKLN